MVDCRPGKFSEFVERTWLTLDIWFCFPFDLLIISGNPFLPVALIVATTVILIDENPVDFDVLV
jgi:hypothetical protein